MYFDGAFSRRARGWAGAYVAHPGQALLCLCRSCFRQGEKVSNNIAGNTGTIAGLKAAVVSKWRLPI